MRKKIQRFKTFVTKMPKRIHVGFFGLEKDSLQLAELERVIDNHNLPVGVAGKDKIQIDESYDRTREHFLGRPIEHAQTLNDIRKHEGYHHPDDIAKRYSNPDGLSHVRTDLVMTEQEMQ